MTTQNWMTESSRFRLEEKETLENYRLFSAADVMTPALAVYEAYVDANIASTLRLLKEPAAPMAPSCKDRKTERHDVPICGAWNQVPQVRNDAGIACSN